MNCLSLATQSDRSSIKADACEDGAEPRTGVNAHAVQHVEHILSGHIARRAGRVRAAAESTHRAERLERRQRRREGTERERGERIMRRERLINIPCRQINPSNANRHDDNMDRKVIAEHEHAGHSVNSTDMRNIRRKRKPNKFH